MRDSRWFKEGWEAAVVDDATGTEKCPYGEGSAKWYLWHEGFEQKQKADLGLDNTAPDK